MLICSGMSFAYGYSYYSADVWLRLMLTSVCKWRSCLTSVLLFLWQTSLRCCPSSRSVVVQEVKHSFMRSKVAVPPSDTVSSAKQNSSSNDIDEKRNAFLTNCACLTSWRVRLVLHVTSFVCVNTERVKALFALLCKCCSYNKDWE